MGPKGRIFIFILSLCILRVFGQLVEPNYFYSSMNSDERKQINIQYNEDQPILTGPSTLDDILPKERDLTIFVDYLKKSREVVSRIVHSQVLKKFQYSFFPSFLPS